MKDLMSEGKDEWGIRRLQNCILNIAKYFNDFCEENNIDYCLMGGSALGAVRHKGFIPWDDDLDVFMRPKEYDKFRELFLEKGDKKLFYLQEWGGKKHITLAKLRYNNSHYVEPDLEKLDIHKGVYIDIFILHSCPDNPLQKFWKYLWARYLVIKALANRNYKRRGVIGNIILQPLRWVPKRALVSYAIRQVYRNEDTKTKEYCHFLGRAGLKKGLYSSEYFRKTKYMPFENIKLRVPERVEEYLKARWGDYMKLPSLEEIKYFQHSDGWSIDKPFKGFNEKGNYKDEKFLIT